MSGNVIKRCRWQMKVGHIMVMLSRSRSPGHRRRGEGVVQEGAGALNGGRDHRPGGVGHPGRRDLPRDRAAPRDRLAAFVGAILAPGLTAGRAYAARDYSARFWARVRP
jgi:hypothetical protein